MENVILEKVVAKLNEKFSFISDFNLYVDGNVIKGGFYWMNYSSCPSSRYAFHEIFAKYNSIENSEVDSEVADLSKIVLRKLKWQKECDESIASDFGKPVKYQFDYSILND